MKKIYNRLIIDIASGVMLAEDAFDYSGPIAEVKGSSKTTTTTKVAAASPDEVRRNAIGDAIQKQQLSDQGYDLIDNGSGGFSLQKRAPTAQEQADLDFQNKLKQQMQESITGVVSPEKQAQIDATYANYETKGNASIDQYARELAGARGLDLNTDSPALREALKARGELQGTLGSAKASAGFDYANQQQLFAQSLNQFQAGLKQQAFQNRQGIADSYNQMGQAMAQNRYGTASRTTTGPGADNSGQIISGGLGAAGAIGGAMIMM